MPIEVISEIVPKNDQPFAIVDDNNVRGGYQVVASTAERDAIAIDNRKAGMQVYCQDSQLIFTLGPNLVTWTELMLSGGGSNNTFIWTQMVSSTVWNIVHNLNKYPSVVTTDSVDRVIMGDVQYIDMNTVQVTFNYMISGKAFLN